MHGFSGTYGTPLFAFACCLGPARCRAMLHLPLLTGPVLFVTGASAHGRSTLACLGSASSCRHPRCSGSYGPDHHWRCKTPAALWELPAGGTPARWSLGCRQCSSLILQNMQQFNNLILVACLGADVMSWPPPAAPHVNLCKQTLQGTFLRLHLQALRQGPGLPQHIDTKGIERWAAQQAKRRTLLARQTVHLQETAQELQLEKTNRIDTCECKLSPASSDSRGSSAQELSSRGCSHIPGPLQGPQGAERPLWPAWDDIVCQSSLTLERSLRHLHARHSSNVLRARDTSPHQISCDRRPDHEQQRTACGH